VRRWRGIIFRIQDPLGKWLMFGFPPDGAAEREIVGIAGDVRDVALGQEPGSDDVRALHSGTFLGRESGGEEARWAWRE